MGTTLPAPSARTMNEASSPCEKLLDHQPVAGGSESPCDHDPVEGRDGLLQVGADQHALAGRQAVGLQHHGIVEKSAPKRLFRGARLVEDPVGGRRDLVAGHEILGEGLAPLQPRRLRRRTHERHSGLAKKVSDAVHQAGFRSDNSQVHALIDGEIQQLPERELRKKTGLGGRRDSGVSRGAVNLPDPVAQAQLPDQRVFSSAGADD